MQDKVMFNVPSFSHDQFSSFASFILPTVKRIQAHLLERARRNTPIKTGALRQSLYVEPTIIPGSIIFDCGSSKDYALRIHEEQYQIQETSQAHEHTIEGGVGSKYFTRVIDYWSPTYAAWIEQAVIQYIEKGFKLQ